MSDSVHEDHFLGSLKSELDESEDALHPYFVALNSAADTVRANYVNWKLRSTAAAQLFQLLKITDIDGREWTVGAVTGGWFRRDGAKSTWMASMPPTGVTPSVNNVPSWYSKGINNLVLEYIADENAVMQEDMETKGRAEERKDGGLAVANPFQSKEVKGLTVEGEVRKSTAGDTDWLFEEWENSSSTAPQRADDPVASPQTDTQEFPGENLFLPPEDNE